MPDALTPEEATAVVAALDRLEQFGLRVSERQRTARDKLREQSARPDEWTEFGDEADA